MSRHRWTDIATTAAAVALVGACAATPTRTSLRSAGSPLPSVAPPPAASVTPPVTSPPIATAGGTHTTGTHSTHSHSAPPPPPPSSAPPYAGDWSASTARGSNGHLECVWKPLPDGNVFIGGNFAYYYSGPNKPKTVDYQVTNSVNSTVTTGTLTYTSGLDGDTRRGSEILGFENPPFKQDGYATVTVTLLPGGPDNRPSDDSVTMTVVLKAGIPPAFYAIDC